MTPFRPTIERTWEALNEVRRQNRGTEGYVVHMGPDLWYEALTDHRLVVAPARLSHVESIFGVPIEVDYSIPRGWIKVRHEVTA